MVMLLEEMEIGIGQGKTVLNNQKYDMCEIDLGCLFSHRIVNYCIM